MYTLVLYVIHFYLPGKTNTTRIIGRFIGILVGVFAAKIYTLSFTDFFSLPPLPTSGLLFLFIATNAGLTSLVYAMNPGARHG